MLTWHTHTHLLLGPWVHGLILQCGDINKKNDLSMLHLHDLKRHRKFQKCQKGYVRVDGGYVYAVLVWVPFKIVLNTFGLLISQESKISHPNIVIVGRDEFVCFELPDHHCIHINHFVSSFLLFLYSSSSSLLLCRLHNLQLLASCYFLSLSLFMHLFCCWLFRVLWAGGPRGQSETRALSRAWIWHGMPITFSLCNNTWLTCYILWIFWCSDAIIHQSQRQACLLFFFSSSIRLMTFQVSIPFPM